MKLATVRPKGNPLNRKVTRRKAHYGGNVKRNGVWHKGVKICAPCYDGGYGGATCKCISH